MKSPAIEQPVVVAGLARRVGVVVAAVLVAGVAGCGGGSRRVEIVVDQPRAVAGALIDVQVLGLGAGQQVSLGAEFRDGNGLRWSAAAAFVADAQGRVDLARDAAIAGSYEGVHQMGLFATLAPDGAAEPSPLMDGVQVTLSVTAGQRTLASRVITRGLLAPGVSTRALSLASDGVVGYYYAPPGGGRRPAVLVFGGSEGGVLAGATVARALASAGYPALGIAYFRAPGLPAALAGIPLEYFGRALAFLRAQPEVDTRRVAVAAASRGSEAAQLLAAHYPTLVDGVIALVPADVAVCGLPDCDRPAWTWHHRPVPFTSQLSNPAPTDNPAAVLPYDRIAAPLFLACGGKDHLWDSCGYARAAIAHHPGPHHGIPDTLLAYPHAGHGVAALPGTSAGGPRLQGDTPTANEDAREQLWPRILAYLQHLPPGPP
jgi:dienelactone hydrolase